MRHNPPHQPPYPQHGPTRIGLLMTAVALLASCDARAEPTPGTRAFFDDSPWQDGQAEVNYYAATELRYGEPREADEAVLIFVKEDHRSDRMVKADESADADLPAVKLNWVTEIPTGIYTYRQQASVFMNRETNRPFRETFASHEWCGNVFKDLRRGDDEGWRYEWTTYFEDDGEGVRQVSTGGEGDAVGPVIVADALPLYLRTVRRNHEVRVLPSLRTIRAEADAFEPVAATITLGREHSLTVPAGTFAVQDVTVTYADDREDRFHLEAGPRRRLIKMELHGGAIYELRRSLRIDYWNRNAPADAALREGTGVE